MNSQGYRNDSHRGYRNSQELDSPARARRAGALEVALPNFKQPVPLQQSRCTFIVQLLQLPDGVTFNGTAAIQCKHERNLATGLGAGRDRRNASVGAG